MNKLVRIGLLAIILAATVQAQTPAPPSAAPQIPDDAKAVFKNLQDRASGLSLSMAVLQKELDATQADFSRLVQRLQAQCATAPGYELSPSLTCVVKKDAAKNETKKNEPAKKDEAKQP